MKSPFHIIARSITTLSTTRYSTPISYPQTLKTLIPGNISSNHRSQHQLQILRNLILQTAASESVRVERLSYSDSGIVQVRLDRPEVKNAIGKDMLKGLQNAFESINEDFSVNVAMICSSIPRVFCAGADLKLIGQIKRAEPYVFASVPKDRPLQTVQERKMMTPPEVRFFVNSLRSTFSFLEALRVPTIAVIEGAALGGGMEMVLSCDLRICGEDAVFSLPETGLAIIPGAGGTQRLPRLIGKAAAKELIFTAKKIDGKEAMTMGLVNHCVPAGEVYLKALQVARDINQKGPLALRMAKRAINEGLEVEMPSALELEEECYEQLLNTKDRLEGLAAFAEKRKPIYTGQ